MKIIVINGIARSGKDTFCEFVAEHHQGPALVHSTVETVKAMARTFFGADPLIKDDRTRRLWSDLKDLWTAYCDGPFNEVVSRHYTLEGQYPDGLLFVHAREPQEIGKLKNYFKDKCVTILVRRPGLPIPDNHADRNVENFPYDIIVNNDGTLKGLEKQAFEFVQKI